MNNKVIILAAMLSGMPAASLLAQRTASSSMYLQAGEAKAIPVIFRVNADLNQLTVPTEPIKWGMDTAWDWDVNVIRGTNFIGKDILQNGIGRVAFQTTDLLDADGNLSAAQKKALQSRLDHIALSGVRNINLNSDQEAYYEVSSYVTNYKNKPENWYKLIKATVKYCRQQGFNVVSISPFNEPDYTAWNQGSQASFKEVARLISVDKELEGIEISAGNTLNCDQALSWYNYVKPYVQKGNTHQLAGSMANYTKFWETVDSDGNTGVADELHNCMEAFIAFHHGAKEGIWWGWEGASRGLLCQATTYGKEIGYAENADTWSGAAVYKWIDPAIAGETGKSVASGISGMSGKAGDAGMSGDAGLSGSTGISGKTGNPGTSGNPGKTASQVADGSAGERVHAFLGCSERQAKPSTFALISADRPAYYDGYGPTYSYSQYVPADPNGSYQSDLQKNAECVVDIQYGEDIPTDYIRSGNFVIMNMFSNKCLSYTSTSTNISQNGYATKPNTRQYWTIETVPTDCGGDFSYSTLKSPGSTDGKNLTTSEEWGLEAGKGIKYSTNWASAGRNHWSFEYAGDNAWYIRNRYTGLYLQPKTAVTTSTAITMQAFTGNKEQKWRFIPVPEDVTKTPKMEQTAPNAPTGLTAKVLSGSVLLSWTANTDADLAAYNIIRSSASGKWDVIGRMVTGTSFLDNDVAPGKTYTYKLKAVDGVRNQSEASEETEVSMPANAKALVARYSFDSNANDTTENCLDAVMSGTVAYKQYLSVAKEGTAAIYLDGSTTFATLPPSLGNMSEMTIAMWICNQSSTKSWIRLFDFGNGTDQYFFLTPNNGSESRLVLKNGGDEQILSAPKIGYGWHYVAVTLSPDSVCLYIDYTHVKSENVTLRPSDFSPKHNFIGKSQFVGDPLFKGYIDDLRIYNYAVSASDVQTLMNGGEISTSITGDVNGDGTVNIADINAVISIICGGSSSPEAEKNSDVNADGTVNIGDINAIISIICGN